jgi:hypothetical protein
MVVPISTTSSTVSRSATENMNFLVVFLRAALSAASGSLPPSARVLFPEPATPVIDFNLFNCPAFFLLVASSIKYFLRPVVPPVIPSLAIS